MPATQTVSLMPMRLPASGPLGLTACTLQCRTMPLSGSSSRLGLAPEHALDAVVFSASGRPFADVMVAGRWVLRGHWHPQAEAVAARAAETIAALAAA